MKRLIAFFALLAASSASFAMLSEHREEELRQKYQAPPKLKATLDAAMEKDEAFRECIKKAEVCKCPNNLPCYVKTYALWRLENLEKIRIFYNQEKLDEIMFPDEYLWNDYLVSEELTPARNSKNKCKFDGITKNQLAQLITFSQIGGVWDFKGRNDKFDCSNIFFSKYLPRQKVLG